MRRIFIASMIFSFLFLGYAYAANENVFFYQAPSMPFVGSNLPLNPIKPVFDIAQAKQDITAVISELQSIPIGGEKIYKRGDTKGISMEKIIDSLINLGIIEFNVENATVNRVNPETGQEETYAGGDFGCMLKECVFHYLSRENELKIIHKEFKPDYNSYKYDLDVYELKVNDKVMELELVRNYFPIDKGLEWGMVNIVLNEVAKDENGNFIGTCETMVIFDFWIKQDGTADPSAIYQVSVYDAKNVLLAYEIWKWNIGNSSSVFNRPWGPPDSK